MFINLVNGGVGNAQLNHFCAGGGDESSIRCAAAGGKLRVYAGSGFDGLASGFHQPAFSGQERPAG